MRTAIIILAVSLFAGVVYAETTIVVNGKTIHTSGSSVSVNNSTVIVDGEVLSGSLVKGSGVIATENRKLGQFSRLHLSINADVTVIAGKQRQCTISAEDNLLPLILTETSGNTLRISAKESYSSTQKIKITVETPLLTSATLDGSGKIYIREVTHDALALLIKGSGDIIAEGRVAMLTATINGSGDVHAGELEAEKATIIVKGSGDADVQVTDALTARIRGSGNITYIGSPPEVNISVSGAGQIAQR